jgi:hypothetical protein
MMICRSLRLILLCTAIALLARPASASWIDDGTPVVQEINNQDISAVVPDGVGGVFVVWQDKRTGPLADIYVQRINAAGNRMWVPAGGVPVCTDPGNQLNSSAASDGAGGVIVTWEDYRAGGDVYAQRLDADGHAMWATNGVPVCTAVYLQDAPKAVPYGAGGAVIVWFDRRSGDFDIYAQRLDPSGTPQWTADGVPLCIEANSQSWPEMIDDGNDGFIVVWEDSRGGYDSDIYAQRIDAGGSPSWITNGVPVCTDTLSQFLPGVVTDGTGGAIVVWEDNRTGIADVYAQRLDGSGTPLWTLGGKTVCTAADNQLEPFVVADGAGGAVVGWTDYRDALNSPDVYAQRLSGAGVPQWTGDGVAVCTAGDGQYLTSIAGDGAGGAYLAWSDSRALSSDIYAQRLDGAGVEQWMTDGEVLCSAAGYQSSPLVAVGDGGCAVVAWTDPRDGDNDVCASATPGCAVSGVAGGSPPLAGAILYQNAPNPFGRSTRIDYELSAPSDVLLEVFDVLGRRVHAQRRPFEASGRHTFDYTAVTRGGEALPAGVYYYRLTAGDTRLTKRMTVIR